MPLLESLALYRWFETRWNVEWSSQRQGKAQSGAAKPLIGQSPATFASLACAAACRLLQRMVGLMVMVMSGGIRETLLLPTQQIAIG
jgi:hypothetical protein